MIPPSARTPASPRPISPASLALAVVLATGCDSQSKDGAPSASAAPLTSAPPAASAPPPAAEPPAPPPDDLDVDALLKALKCATDAKSGPCAVLAAMKSCAQWNPVVPSGDGRWLGRGTVVDGGKTSQEITVLRSRRVPTAEAGAGQLPARLAVTAIPSDDKTAVDQAERAIRQLERHDVVPKSNAALEWVKKNEVWPDAPARRTAGGQVIVLASDGDTFLCQGQKQQLLLVRRTKAGAKPGDGTYAELWAATW